MDIRSYIGRWIWLCPLGAVGLAVVILTLFGLSVWTAVVVAILLVCPVMIVWGAIRAMRRQGGSPKDRHFPGGKEG